jgi:hypothetical protein
MSASDSARHCHSYVRQLAGRAAGREAITGSGGWSLSDSVCVLKETARAAIDGSEDL